MLPNRDEIVSHLFSLKKPIVIGHESADPDAVGAAYVLGSVLKANIGFPGVSREGKQLLRILNTSYELFPSVKGLDVIVVDTNRAEKLGGIDLSKANSVTVIDHHASEPNIEGTLFIFPNISSTSEIVYWLFRDRSLSEKEKLALLTGILFDTKHLRSARGPTLEVVGRLLENRTLEEITELFPEDVSERIAKLKALRKGEILRIDDFLIAYTNAGSFESSVASILISAGADIAVAYTESNKVDRMSIRLSRRVLKLGLDALRLVESVQGSCGGHKAAVGCTLPPKSSKKAVEIVVENAVKLLRAFGISGPVRRY